MANNLPYPRMESGSILGALVFVRIRADAEDILILAATVDDANLPATAAALADAAQAIIDATTDARAAIETLLIAYLDIARGQRETAREIRQLKELYAQLLEATRSSPTDRPPP